MKKQNFYVNKQGISSVYAVLFLMIVTSFVAVIILQTMAYASSQTTERNLHYVQLFSIYHAKEMLSMYDNTLEKPFTIEQEICNYDGYDISFTYVEEKIEIRFQNVQFFLTFDKTSHEILDLVYFE